MSGQGGVRGESRGASWLRRAGAGPVRVCVVLALLGVLAASIWVMHVDDVESSVALTSARLQTQVREVARVEWEQVAIGRRTPETIAEIRDARSAVTGDLEMLRAAGTDRPLVATAGRLTDAYLATASQVDRALAAGQPGAARALQANEAEGAFDEVRTVIRTLVDHSQREAATAKTRTRVSVFVLALLPLFTLALPAWWRARRRSFRYEARLSAMIGHASDPFIEFDAGGALRTWSPQAEAVLGWRAEEVLGRAVSEVLFTPRQRARIEASLEQLNSGDWAGLNGRRETVVLDASGRERWMEITFWPSVIRGRPRMSGFLHDITDRRRLEARLRSEAENDSLTGLTNRRTFQRRLQDLCGRPSRRGGAVVFLDLDNFKTINDTYGHRTGDRILQATAARIRQAISTSDGAVAARFGGDEFAVLVPDINRAEARWLAASLVAGLHQSFHADEHEMLVSTSVGLVVLPDGRFRAEDVMRDADLAMYAAKSRGRNAWAEFEPSMYEAMSADTRMEADLRAALRAGTVEVHYQPVVSLPHGRPYGVEALARWHHPELGEISPARFIPLAEQRNLIVPVGAYVLLEACGQLARWRSDYGEQAPRTVAVNVSLEQLRDRRFTDVVQSALESTGLIARDLVLEVTETAQMQDGAVADSLHRLHQLGVGLALDDFGTGHSSLARLRELPVDSLKVDRTFLENIAKRGADPMVSAIVSMADGLELDVVVEGIESTTQAEYVSWLGCSYGQGFLYSPALAPDALMSWWLEHAGPLPSVKQPVKQPSVKQPSVPQPRHAPGGAGRAGTAGTEAAGTEVAGTEAGSAEATDLPG